MYVRHDHRRTGQHPLGGGGRLSFDRMDSVGGGVVAEIFRDSYFSVVGGGVVAEIFRARFGGGGVGGKIGSVNCSDRPSIRIIHTFIVFYPNHFNSARIYVHKLAELPPAPPRPVRLWT